MGKATYGSMFEVRGSKQTPTSNLLPHTYLVVLTI